jgi:hypothetical protein
MIMEKVSHGRPITTAPADADLELSLYDEVEYHVLVFPCRRDGSSCCDVRANRPMPLTVPSRPGELHPESLTDPDVILSHHPARATMRRLPPSIDDQVPPAAG